jgi:hypothetical protein
MKTFHVLWFFFQSVAQILGFQFTGRNFFVPECFFRSFAWSSSKVWPQTGNWIFKSNSDEDLDRSESGWPDWANFRPMGDCLLLAVPLKSKMYPTCLGYYILWIGVSIYIFWQKNGLQLGWFFHKLIWSPWVWLTFNARTIFLPRKFEIKSDFKIGNPMRFCRTYLYTCERRSLKFLQRPFSSYLGTYVPRYLQENALDILKTSGTFHTKRERFYHNCVEVFTNLWKRFPTKIVQLFVSLIQSILQVGIFQKLTQNVSKKLA